MEIKRFVLRLSIVTLVAIFLGQMVLAPTVVNASEEGAKIVVIGHTGDYGGAQFVTIWNWTGDFGGTFPDLGKGESLAQNPRIAVGDVNGDGKDEYVVVGRTGDYGGAQFVTIWNQAGGFLGTFPSPEDLSKGNSLAQNPRIAVGDVNGDGKNETVVVGHTEEYGGAQFVTIWDWNQQIQKENFLGSIPSPVELSKGNSLAQDPDVAVGHLPDLPNANKAVLPVPGRTPGSHSNRFDIVFVPDNDYGSPADTDTWLPTFLDHINHQIDERLGGAAPVTGNLDKFNFYYTRRQGDAISKTLPTDLTQVSTFADVYVIFHTAEFQDSTVGNIYSAEGWPAAPYVPRSFIHESGHGIFGLADEYDDADADPPCRTFRWQPHPKPNVWATVDLGRADATREGWNPDDIWKFTDCRGDWWKLGTTEYIMSDGSWFANGWGDPASRRIQWVLDQYPTAGGTGGETSEKSIWLDLDVSSGVFSLKDKSFVIDSPPDYLPGKYDFTAKVFSTSGKLIGEYGFNDPRRVLAEPGYVGPTWLDSVNFQLVLPYFSSGSKVDLIESATGSVKLSVDISQFATGIANQLPVANPGGPYIGDEGSAITFDGSASYDPDAGDSIIRYEWDFDYDGVTFTVDDSGAALKNPSYTYADGPVSKKVALRVTSSDKSQNIATADVTVNNVAPVVDAGPDAAINEGDAFSSSGSFTDPGADTWTANVDYGDGSGVQPLTLTGKTFALSHTYADNCACTVTVTVTDDDGGVGIDTAIVTVKNVAPTVTIKDSYFVTVPVTLRIAGQGMVGNSVALEVIQDGNVIATNKIIRNPVSPNEQEVTISAIIDLSKPYSGRLKFDTEQAYSGGTPVWVIIDGVKTKVTTFNTQKSNPASYHQTYDFALSGLVSVIGKEISFTGSATDPGADDMTFDWLFGDGGSATKLYPWPNSHSVTETVKHTYSAAGSYTVNLKVTDDDGGVGTASKAIAIS